ncbi:MAG: alpha-galactosidase [Clostridia bacterium]|nr:alpha-galactosidase [Clostridia bacterium]
MLRNYTNPMAENWYREMLADPAAVPITFVYDGIRYTGLGNLTLLEEKTESGIGKETTVRRYRLDDCLTVTLVTAFCPDYGAGEWTVWFANEGAENSAILADVESVLTFTGESPLLRGILGDHENFYSPYEYDLTETPVHFVSDSGRPTHVNFPYFNLEYGNGGVMLAIGWAGTWTADFAWDGTSVTYTARSTNRLSTYLKPGEKVRTALFVRAPYTVRDENWATNYWRSWFIDCNLPPFDAENPLHPMSTCFLAYDTGLPNSDGSISERHYTWRPSMEKILAEGLHMDIRWFDAGWYIAPDGTSPITDWWGTVGTWELDKNKWPGKTFLESTDFAREHGMRTMMWFEPERVTDPDNLVKHYGYRPEWAIRREGIGSISNNIGIPECLAWTTERVCRVLRENRVEIYREDNNSDPGALWQYLDSLEGENRQGITESKFVIGHYKMWDDIIACTLSFGGCGFVDSCASGGGRNDLESLRRGVPMLRSDFDRTTTSMRLSMTTSFNKWVPFCGANTKEKVGQVDLTGRSDRYIWRASYLPVLNVDSQYVQDPDQDFDNLRFGLAEWKKVSSYMMKDFYPLTEWHDNTYRAGFTAYSFVDPAADSGYVMAFRMEDCPEDTLTLTLPYAGNDTWRLTDEDTGEAYDVQNGKVTLTFAQPRTARLLWVEKA